MVKNLAAVLSFLESATTTQQHKTLVCLYFDAFELIEQNKLNDKRDGRN